ncbi:DUF402 domain-containing protein [Alkalicoccobacillus gibsonii]|uniref:DUF402 domain-containing protein n=1 Tax=Alkalicoccobacillus gibsonii TaxID=79881 RepID=UPI003511FEF2
MTHPKLERKYANRPGWKRVLKKKYSQKYLISKEFTGHVTLIEVQEVTEPLVVQYESEKVRIVDSGFVWLQHFPDSGQHVMTTVFNEKGEVVQWYIDICNKIGITKGIPWYEDLILDLVVLPTGEIFQLDFDELEDLLQKGNVSFSLYQIARDVMNNLLQAIKDNNYPLFKKSKEHKDELYDL